MTAEHQKTPEEEAYGRLLEANGEMLSKAARIILQEADLAAYTHHLVHNVIFAPEEYDEAMEKMRFAAVDLTAQDRELLAEVWRSVLAAAASINPEDETSVGYKVNREDLHWYYRMLSGMVETVLEEKKIADIEARLENDDDASSRFEDFEDIPF